MLVLVPQRKDEDPYADDETHDDDGEFDYDSHSNDEIETTTATTPTSSRARSSVAYDVFLRREYFLRLRHRLRLDRARPADVFTGTMRTPLRRVPFFTYIYGE